MVKSKHASTHPRVFAAVLFCVVEDLSRIISTLIFLSQSLRTLPFKATTKDPPSNTDLGCIYATHPSADYLQQSIHSATKEETSYVVSLTIVHH